MHVTVDIHSLPGGLNGFPFGEASGHYGWFNNQTALEYSLKAVDAAISFIQSSGFPQSFTLEPINQPVDVEGVSLFGTPYCLTDRWCQLLGELHPPSPCESGSRQCKNPGYVPGKFEGRSILVI